MTRRNGPLFFVSKFLIMTELVNLRMFVRLLLALGPSFKFTGIILSSNGDPKVSEDTNCVRLDFGEMFLKLCTRNLENMKISYSFNDEL